MMSAVCKCCTIVLIWTGSLSGAMNLNAEDGG